MDRGEQAALELAARKLFPALSAFTRWVLGRAGEEGISRLYFLARDGWFPFRLARRLAAAWDLPVECRYLYGSRLAWRLPLYREDHGRALDQLCGGGMLQTPEQVLARTGLSRQEQDAVGKALGESGKKLLHPRALRETLGSCALFWKLLDNRSEKALPLLEEYFRQEGLLEAVSWAVVDSGWMGSTQETLSRLLEIMRGPGKTAGFYAGLYRGPQSGTWDCFFFRPGRDLGVQAAMEPCFFEAVFAPPQGTVLGYARQEGNVVPLLGQPPEEEAPAFLGKAFQALEEELAGKSPPWDLTLQALEDRPRAWALLRQLMTRPGREEAKALGRLPFSCGEEEPLPLAGFLTGEELKKNTLASRLLRGKPLRESFWLPGTSALYGENPPRQFVWWDRLRWARTLAHRVR